MRIIRVDVHRDFRPVTIAEEGRFRFSGQVVTAPSELEMFAGTLPPGDVVAVEATTNALGDRPDR